MQRTAHTMLSHRLSQTSVSDHKKDAFKGASLPVQAISLSTDMKAYIDHGKQTGKLDKSASKELLKFQGRVQTLEKENMHLQQNLADRKTECAHLEIEIEKYKEKDPEKRWIEKYAEEVFEKRFYQKALTAEEDKHRKFYRQHQGLIVKNEALEKEKEDLIQELAALKQDAIHITVGKKFGALVVSMFLVLLFIICLIELALISIRLTRQ